ncbi:late embryogenesis abundant protein At5g17165-like [Lycium ferocissimum]|uniref:late embryogenesis abundant protein At5g17165-like n=1 Tax=Lycium ferocissimum TaxID=112874 RepID=UPI0028149DCA|nr:late embryogenesis abundant protein At5g17165-like [Lycium ferocissimum]
MAANLQKRGLVSLGKRFMNHISYSTARNSTNSSTGLSGRRAVHMSVYDKNPEEYLSSVPDEVIKVQSDKYWTPHPQTGVFGPATDHIICGEQSFHFCPVDSVLEQKVFFRADLEDLE